MSLGRAAEGEAQSSVGFWQDWARRSSTTLRGWRSLETPKLTRRPTRANPTPFTDHLIRSCADVWEQYVKHPFVVQLGKGTLPLEAFKHYIVQDWHYLRHCECARARESRSAA